MSDKCELTTHPSNHATYFLPSNAPDNRTINVVDGEKQQQQKSMLLDVRLYIKYGDTYNLHIQPRMSFLLLMQRHNTPWILIDKQVNLQEVSYLPFL